MKNFKGKVIFCFSIVEDQDINLLGLLDISKYYRLLGLIMWYCYFLSKISGVVDSSRLTVISAGRSELISGSDICSSIIRAVGLGSKAAVQ